MRILPTLDVETATTVAPAMERKQEITLGLCVQCDLKYNCVWLSDNKQFCEHYQ